MLEARINLRVQPGAKRSEVVGLAGGVVRVRVAAPAREGRANEAVVELLSELLDVPKGRVRILRGYRSKDKTVAIAGVDSEEALRRLLPR